MSASRKWDSSVRTASITSTLVVVGGFIGVSAGSLPDTIAFGGLVVISIWTMAAYVGLLSSDDDWSRKKLFGSITLSVVLFVCLWLLTGRPWLSGGIAFGSLYPIMLQNGPVIYELEDEVQKLTDITAELKERTDQLVAATERYNEK